MDKAADRGFGLAGGIARLLPLSFVSLLFLPGPSLADVAPESGLLLHLQPVSGSCETAVTHCTEIVRTTTEEGQMEFLLFFMNGALTGGGDCLEEVHTVLTWPPAWEFVEGEQCGWLPLLEAAGSTLALDLSWYGYLVPLGTGYGTVVPLVRIVMNVNGPGQLDFSGPGTALLRSGCSGPHYTTQPVQVLAEAGVQCGYLTPQCGYYTVCEPVFHHPTLALTAPSGGVADTSFTFLVAAYWQTCSLVVDTHAPWCAASISIPGPWVLHVTADATELPPGVYETPIELISTTYGVSRCLPTTLTVEASTGVPAGSTSWGRVKTLYR